MKWFRAARYKFNKLLARQTVLHCIGDSHVQHFKYLAREYRLPLTDMRFCIVQGATNMGLANPHSQTQAMPIFANWGNTRHFLWYPYQLGFLRNTAAGAWGTIQG